MNSPTEETPVPGLDSVAALRWLERPRTTSPWLHEEVARRMVERLQWIRQPPDSWIHWEPVLGGLSAHRLLADRLPGARCLVSARNAGAALQSLSTRHEQRFLWPWRRSAGPGLVEAGSRAAMLWANMLLHQESRPQALLRRWHGHIDVGGFLMFSCLGPDSLRELRAVYAGQGWPQPAHEFTDMHDWGDMLVQSGFAEPVMDMERISLTYSSAVAMLDELRTFGRNLATSRFAALRGRRWRERLVEAIEQHGARNAQGRLCLEFEVIYGHAFKAAPRPALSATQSVSLDNMKAMLRDRRH